MESIYERIRAAVGPDGTLPKNFSIQPNPLDPKALRFADGAMDGIVFYHARAAEDPQLLQDLKGITSMVACGGDAGLAAEKLAGCFGERDGMLGCVDTLQQWIVENRAGLDAGRLFGFACALLTESGYIGPVKYALSVLELLAAAQGQWRELVRTLALSDELALYCVFVACRWENKDEELFQMARKVRGWGRVHAVRELEPTTREMRDWLLDEGWDNDVLPSYTALACAQRGGLRQRLEKQELSRERLDAAGGLIRGLLDEGPVRNISLMEDREPLLLAYLAQVERSGRTQEDLQTVQSILGSAAEDTLDLPQVRARAQTLLDVLKQHRSDRPEPKERESDA